MLPLIVSSIWAYPIPLPTCTVWSVRGSVRRDEGSSTARVIWSRHGPPWTRRSGGKLVIPIINAIFNEQGQTSGRLLTCVSNCVFAREDSTPINYRHGRGGKAQWVASGRNRLRQRVSLDDTRIAGLKSNLQILVAPCRNIIRCTWRCFKVSLRRLAQKRVHLPPATFPKGAARFFGELWVRMRSANARCQAS